MQRIAYKAKAGSLKNLKREEEDLPRPEPNQVTVEVRSIGLNFADVFALQGLYSATPEGVFIPGLEFAGQISNVGDNVEKKLIGKKVFGVTRFGAYTNRLNIESDYVVQLPKMWSFNDGAAFPAQALTAYYAVVALGDMQPGHVVLIHSAAGGVGVWANRICQKIGGIIIGAVGREEKLSVLKDEGYNHGIVRGKDLKEKVLECSNGKNPDLVLECIGGKTFYDSYEILERQGRIITYGAAHFSNNQPKPNMIKAAWKYLRRPKIDPLKMMRENKSVLAFNLIWLFDKTSLFNQMTNQLLDMDLGKPLVGHTYAFDQLPEAIKHFQKGTTVGKVVVEV